MQFRKSIDVIASFTVKDGMVPRRFRLIDEDGDPVIYPVDKVVSVSRASGRMFFECVTNNFNGRRLTYQLCYIEADMSWILIGTN